MRSKYSCLEMKAAAQDSGLDDDDENLVSYRTEEIATIASKHAAIAEETINMLL